MRQERHRGELTDAKVDRVAALVTDGGASSSASVMARLDVLLALTEDELAALAPRPGEERIPVPNSPDELRKRIADRAARDRKVPDGTGNGDGKGDGKGDGGGTGDGVGAGGKTDGKTDAAVSEVTVPEKVRRLAALLQSGGAKLDPAHLTQLEALAADATPVQIGAIAGLGLVPPAQVDAALALIAQLLALPPEEIRRLAVRDPARDGTGVGRPDATGNGTGGNDGKGNGTGDGKGDGKGDGGGTGDGGGA
ncbi:MAG: hypothetical protein ABMB14_14985, partial [Myxococcota bacterium]